VALLNNGDNILVTMVGNMVGQTIMNTFYYRVTQAPGTLLQQADVLESLDNLLNSAGNLFPKVLAAIPPEYSFEASWLQVVFPGRYVAYKFPEVASGQGDAPGITANLAGVVVRRTDKAGRDQVGTLHVLVGSGDEGVLNGRVGGATKVALDALAASLPTSYTVSGYTFRPVLTPFNNPDGSAKWIDSAFAQDTARVMRRRTVGLGI